jgi:sugar lactone lactonase YvrE
MESNISEIINENIIVDDSNPNYKITYFKNFLSWIAESPVWHPSLNKFFWLDCYGSRIFTLSLPE